MASQQTLDQVAKMSNDNLLESYRSSLTASLSEDADLIRRLSFCEIIVIFEKELRNRLSHREQLVELLEEYRKAGLINEEFVEQLEEYRKTK